jgi:uncharacterized protein (TIGR02448 family)
MRTPLIAATLGLFLLADMAQAQTVVATSNIIVRAFGRSIDFTSDTTTSIRDSKVVLEARDDAASYVASNWRLHSTLCASVSLRPAAPAIKTSPKPSSHCEATGWLPAGGRPADVDRASLCRFAIGA